MELSAGLADCLENTAPSTAVRINRRKVAEDALPTIAAGGKNVAWCRSGFYLPVRPDFTHDPAMHQGVYYVQDASSMILHHVVEWLAGELERTRGAGGSPLRYLDGCAAPGGKTTAAIDALPEGSIVVANEFDFRRAEILKENVVKWGYPNVVVSRGDTARFRRLAGMFDIVAADVPCSGEGMMRKDETARTQWSEGLVGECAALQRQIVANLWEALRPGGYMIYSTCTFNRVENEGNVEWMVAELGAERVEVPLPPDSGIVTDGTGTMRFLPTWTEGEGLFMAVLRKPADGSAREAMVDAGGRKGRKENRKGGKKGGSGKESPMLKDCRNVCGGWLREGFTVVPDEDVIVAVPDGMLELTGGLEQNLDVIYRGVELGTVKGRSLVPSQALALSTALCADAFERVDVDLPTALAYLRRESLPSMGTVKGFVLLCYGGRPLGFVNNLPNRANNLYPQHWRILK